MVKGPTGTKDLQGQMTYNDKGPTGYKTYRTKDIGKRPTWTIDLQGQKTWL